ncbi:MAG TPA: hypothetical protein VGQ05_11330 [Streptosporangiaceae bacterium]|nr:hypothetical protein [Streptosporangiaceae bacterium]
MTQVSAAPGKTRAQISERTLRKDPWWRAPIVTAVLLTGWVAYATVRVFMGRYYWVPAYHYLTPFYSPCVSGSCADGSATLGTWFGKVPSIIPYAIVSLPFVLGFRLTCYYYRRAYYRAFWRSPAACAVREPHRTYSGETRFPLILQNLHRYFFYVVILISLLNTWDVIDAFHGKTGGIGLGLGTLIMLVNVVLLWAYTVSCHTCRHITGGRLKNFSKHPVRYWAWTQVSKLNTRHMQLAWTTLATLMLTDLYIALVASGTISDLRIFN